MKYFRIYAIVEAESLEQAREDYEQNKEMYSFDVEEAEDFED